MISSTGLSLFPRGEFMAPIYSRIDSRVKVPADVALLSEFYWIKLEPPYWYLRCCYCDQRQLLPWDEQRRTKTAIAMLTEHGQQCAAKNPLPDKDEPPTFWAHRDRELSGEDAHDSQPDSEEDDAA